MSEESKERKRQRRRQRWEEWLREMARRGKRRGDPATKTLLQLLALLAAALALARPSEPTFDIAPGPRRRTRYDPPPGYTLGRNAWARERGLEPEPATVLGALENPTPRLRPALKSWRRLVRELDSRSPRRREAARAALEQRLPSVVHDWLRRQIASDDRTQFRALGLGAGPAELVERALRAARIETVQEPEEPPLASPEADSDEPEFEEHTGPGPRRR